MDNAEATSEVTLDAPSIDAETPVTPTETQERPNNIAAMEKQLRRANKEAEEMRLRLKEIDDASKSETQKLQEERDALKASLETLELDRMRRDVADQYGLTPALAARLVGATRDELEADAEQVAALFSTKPKPVFGDVGQGARAASAQRVYTAKELNDHAFFMEHKADIHLAQREGRITD
jgi:TolA-binding protein